MNIITDVDNGELSIGAKRNLLLDKAKGVNSEYIAFFDDDDMPGKNYVQQQLNVAHSGMDCGSLTGAIYFGKRKDMRLFYHSLKYDHWYEDKSGYYRCPNHLNAVKLEHVKHLNFQETNFGEDGNWSMDMQKAGVLKTEYQINEVIYHYFTGQNKDFAWECRTMEGICV